MLIVQKHLQALTRALVGKDVAPIGELLAKIKQQAEQNAELQAQNEKPPEDIFVCKCGWWGDIEALDALGSKCGCCPTCGNEKLVRLSELQAQLRKEEK